MQKYIVSTIRAAIGGKAQVIFHVMEDDLVVGSVTRHGVSHDGGGFRVYHPDPSVRSARAMAAALLASAKAGAARAEELLLRVTRDAEEGDEEARLLLTAAESVAADAKANLAQAVSAAADTDELFPEFAWVYRKRQIISAGGTPPL